MGRWWKETSWPPIQPGRGDPFPGCSKDKQYPVPKLDSTFVPHSSPWLCLVMGGSSVWTNWLYLEQKQTSRVLITGSSFATLGGGFGCCPVAEAESGVWSSLMFVYVAERRLLAHERLAWFSKGLIEFQRKKVLTHKNFLKSPLKEKGTGWRPLFPDFHREN